MFYLRQTSQYAKYMKSIGWIVERIDNTNYFIKKIPILGSVIKVQRPGKIDLEQIDKLAKKYRAFQTILEPKDNKQEAITSKHGFKLSRSPSLPSKTIHIDLTKPEETLLSEMHYKTRYNTKKASQSPNFKVQISKSIEKFADFWQSCALKQRGMFLNQKKEIIEIYKAFENNADLLFALHSNELVAGILLLHIDKMSYYMFAASSNEGKKLFAPTMVTWEAIKISKKRGSKIFDFEGIFDERFPLKTWLGFTRFKKSFGGREVEYPGAFTKFRLPL